MKLNQLAERTGVPVSSIKFYLREALVPPGEKLNATTARYEQAHVDRLELIKALREIIGLSLVQVRRVVTAVDAVAAVGTVELMGTVQTVVLDFLHDRPGPGAPACPGNTDGPQGSDGPEARLTAAGIAEAMGWLAGTDGSMAALDLELSQMSRWGLAPGLDTALVYARAVDAVAAVELGATRRPGEPAPWEVLAHGGTHGGGPSRDHLALYVALGVYSYSRLLLRLLSVAQGSHARRGGGAAGDTP